MLRRADGSRALVALIAAIGVGCSSYSVFDPYGPDPIEETFEGTKRKLPPSWPTTQEPPDYVREALLPPLAPDPQADEDAAGDAVQRFDVAVERAPVRQFLMNLVEDTPYGMIVHPEVSGEISMNLKNVSVPQVLETVQAVYGYPYRELNGGFEVMPAVLRTRVFRVDYLNVVRTGSSQTRVSSGQVSEQGASSSSDSDSSGESQQTSTITGTRVDTSTQADFWIELEETVRAIVGEGPGRMVTSSPHAGIITVRAMGPELVQVEDYLESAHRNLTRQVIIEAKILEVQLDDGYQQGINWSGLIGNSVKGSQTGGGTSLPGTGPLQHVVPSDTSGNAGVLDPAALSMIEGAAASAFGGVFSIALMLDDFAAFVELLDSQGDVEVLSSPRISTVNNQKAVIKVGSDEFFVTDISTTTVTGAATTSSPDVTLTPFFSGIALDVTPHISADDTITLHVHPSVSQVTDQTKEVSLGSGSSTLRIPLAFSTVRESDSIVRARSGQVIVIGGLIENVLDEDDAQVPLLGDVPYLGGLFRQSRKAARKSELVILLRPEVVDDRVWARRVERSSARYRDMRRRSD